jgi:membrane-bound serine protease (ClpP class)
VRRALLPALLALFLVPSAHGASCCRIQVLRFDAEVNPVTAHWLDRQINAANDDRVDLIVIELDTPGGLESSMRQIVKKELASNVPIAVYVAPPGARAASAGVWISEAADVLAMAPGTNIGSSTPIEGTGQNIGSDLRRKVVNDAAASLRSLAKGQGRNARWADRAVRVASNLTEREALRMNVIDLVAPNLTAFLREVDGRTTVLKHLTVHSRPVLELRTSSPGFLTRVLSTLIDPNLLFLLFFAGLAGIGFEIFHPGVVLPGALGGVALVLALFGFATLPTNWAGVILILLAAVLFVADAHVVSHGALTLSGIVSLIVGGLLLFHDAPAPYHTSVPLVVSVAVVLGGFWAFALAKAVQVRRRPVAVGVHELVGAPGVVRDGGLVFLRGELWRARSVDGEPLEPGDRVRVEAVEGLRVAVRHEPEPAQVP